MRTVMQPTGTTVPPSTTTPGGANHSSRGEFGIICLSVCLSDWDKRKRPFASSCVATRCEGRRKKCGEDRIQKCRLSQRLTDGKFATEVLESLQLAFLWLLAVVSGCYRSIGIESSTNLAHCIEQPSVQSQRADRAAPAPARSAVFLRCSLNPTRQTSSCSS